MKLRPLLLWLIIIVMAVLGGLQWHHQQQTARQLDWLFGTLRSHVVLRFDQLFAPIWGGLRLRGVHLTVGEQGRQAWRPPSGLYWRAPRVQVQQLSIHSDGWVDHARIDAPELEMPALAGLLGGRPWHLLNLQPIPLPALGYEKLMGSQRWELQRLPQARSLRIASQAQWQEALDWSLMLDLDVDQRIFRGWPEDAGLRSLEATITDRGLLQRYKQTLALQQRITLAAAERRMIEQIDQYARDTELRWDEDSQKAMRRFLRAGGSLRITMLPLPDFELRNLELYGAAHWPVLLGLRLEQSDPDERTAP